MIFLGPLARGMILAVRPVLERNEMSMDTCERVRVFHSEVGKLFDRKVK
jgi:hypothetical protein